MINQAHAMIKANILHNSILLCLLDILERIYRHFWQFYVFKTKSHVEAVLSCELKRLAKMPK